MLLVKFEHSSTVSQDLFVEELLFKLEKNVQHF